MASLKSTLTMVYPLLVFVVKYYETIDGVRRSTIYYAAAEALQKYIGGGAAADAARGSAWPLLTLTSATDILINSLRMRTIILQY